MIISHKHKFIFIKTHKTAGTSIEIALSKYCGEDDVITPIVVDDELIRKGLGYRGPQNCYAPLLKYTKRNWRKLILSGRRVKFFNHAPASFVKKYVDNDVWNSYYKFSFERNPWDKAVSWYYWVQKGKPYMSISDFIRAGWLNRIKGFDLYSISGEIAVDRVCMFENLQDEIEILSSIIGLPEVPELPQAKTKIREDKRHYRDILEVEDREAISQVFSREITSFGYQW